MTDRSSRRRRSGDNGRDARPDARPDSRLDGHRESPGDGDGLSDGLNDGPSNSPGTRYGDGEARHGAGTRYGRRFAVLAVVLVVAGGITAGAVALNAHARRPAGVPTDAAKVATTTVTRTDLSDSRSLPGSLGYGSATPVTGHGSGVVTALAATGSTVTRGHSLYRSDDQPVILFYGTTPLFRTLKVPTGTDANGTDANGTNSTNAPADGTADKDGTADTNGEAGKDEAGKNGTNGTAGKDNADGADGTAGADSTDDTAADNKPQRGRDVTVVADNLQALGYDIGYRPPDNDGLGATYTPSLAAAVKRWQRHAGMAETGTLGPGQIVVLPGAVRIGAVQAHLGDPVAATLLSVTATGKTVSVPVEAGDAGGITAGAEVTITLPDDRTVPGKVASVGQSVQAAGQDPTDQDSPPTLNVSVTPEHPADVAQLAAAPVQVLFTASTRKGVLAVPLTALVALKEGGYALQRTDGTLVAVTTGLFADGKVEVSGTGVTAGLRVETAS